MSQFGHTGRLHFTAINQPWLRAAAKEWAIEDLLHHRGATVTSTMQAHVAALARTSAQRVGGNPFRACHRADLRR
jgi:hypothetical protein